MTTQVSVAGVGIPGPGEGKGVGISGTLPCDLSHDPCDVPTLPLWAEWLTAHLCASGNNHF